MRTSDSLSARSHFNLEELRRPEVRVSEVRSTGSSQEFVFVDHRSHGNFARRPSSTRTTLPLQRTRMLSVRVISGGRVRVNSMSGSRRMAEST